MIANLDLPKPHGFLIWRGKQTAIASVEPLEAGKELLLTSDGEAFGYLTLSQPARMVDGEFDRLENADKHRIRPEERLLLWPDSVSFYVHPIAEFKGFSKTKRFDGTIVERKLTGSELRVIEQVRKLPKQIVVVDEAVVLDSTGHKCIGQCQDVSELHKAIEVTLNGLDMGDNELALYDLALVRKPLLLLKKKEGSKQEANMPWDIRESFGDCSGFAVVKESNDGVEGCHETREDAEAQLAALNITEGEMTKSIETKGFLSRLAEMSENAKSQLSGLGVTFGEMVNAIKLIKDSPPEAKMFDTEAGFRIKEINGEPWLFTWSANAFEDREKEIFSTKSLETWVKKVEDREVKGYFNFYHIPGTDFAEKRWVAVPGRILVEAGPFLDNELGRAALKTLKRYPDGHPEVSPEGWGCSVEYKYLPEERVTGVYENIDIPRTSVLPLFAAANIWTKVNEVKNMAMTEEQKKASVVMFGDDLASRLIGDAENKSVALESNARYKANGEGAEEAAGRTTEEAAEETTKAEVLSLDTVADAVAKQLSKQFSIDLEPLVEAIGVVVESQKKFEDRLNKFEKTEETARKHNMTKQMFNLVCATTAEDTKLADDDELKTKKPKESTRAQQDGSLAGAFFTGV